MPLPHSIYIREVGPREGFQTYKGIVSTEVKLNLIKLLNKTGLKEIEITSLVRPDLVPQMADAEDFIARFECCPGVRYTALYLNKKGFERAESLGRVNNVGWLYAAPSETFLKKNSNTSLAQVVAGIPEWLALFRRYQKPLHGLMVSTAFGCGYEGEMPIAKVVGVIAAMVSAVTQGCGTLREICLADTVGLANPTSIQELVAACQKEWPTIETTLHLHDTRGTGIANVYAGLLAGVKTFDCSIGGLGGCPFTPGAAGNVATEDVVYLCHSLGIETGVDLPALVACNQYLSRELKSPLFSKYAQAVGGQDLKFM